MTAQDETVLSEAQCETFQVALHHGATEASEALRRWIGRPTRLSCDGVNQLPLCEATSVLGDGGEPLCYCSAEMRGQLTGQLVLAFGDASGFALADMLLGQALGTASEWGEMETSAALETANILCCAYLNAMARVFPVEDGESTELLPGPPRFSRDFAESLLECVLMGQLAASDYALLSRTQFHIDGAPVAWTLLIVPDAASMVKLRGVLPES